MQVVKHIISPIIVVYNSVSNAISSLAMRTRGGNVLRSRSGNVIRRRG